ncbi:MAG: PAS domain S-box protein [Pseudomonadota bacterium]
MGHSNTPGAMPWKGIEMVKVYKSWLAQLRASVTLNLFKQRSVAVAVVLCVALAGGGWWFVDKIQEQYGYWLGTSLSTSRSVLQQSVTTWWEYRVGRLVGWAHESDVREGSLATLRAYRSGARVHPAAAFKGAAEHLDTFTRNTDFIGYALLDKNYRTVTTNSILFSKHAVLDKEVRKLLEHVKIEGQGGAVYWFGARLNDGDISFIDIDHVFLFSAVLLDDNAQVEGYLVGVVNPAIVLHKIFQSAQFGRTGEAVAVDLAGRLISPPRGIPYREHLFTFPKYIPPNFAQKNSHTSSQARSVTPHATMSSSEISASQLYGYPRGYRNYRGDRVVGVWGGLTRANLAIGMEAATDEMFKSILNMRVAIVVAVVALMVLIGVLGGLMARDRIRQGDAIKTMALAEESLQALWQHADQHGTFVRSVVDSLRAAIAVVDVDGRVDLINGAWRRQAVQCGISEAALEPIGAIYFELCTLPEMFLPTEGRVFEGIHQVLARTKGYYWSQYRRQIAGKERWFLVNAEPFETRAGAVISHSDITEQKRAEMSVEASERRLRTIIEMAADGIVTVDERGIIELFSPAAERIFNYSTDEMIGQNISILAPSDHRILHDGYIANYMEHGESAIIGTGREVQGRRKNGEIFPLDIAISAVEIDNRRYFTAIVRDVTERKRAEADIHASKELAEKYLDISGAIIVGLDRTGAVMVINPGGCALIGRVTGEVLGRNWFELVIPKEERGDIEEYFDEVVSGVGESFPTSWRGRVMSGDGDILTVAWNMYVDRDASGTVFQVLFSGQDITDQRGYEDALIHAKNNAEQASRVKSDFLSSMSHEIRTPLNAIVGFSEILANDCTLNKDQMDSVGTVYKAATHLLALVNDILDLSAIEAGKFNIEDESVDVPPLIRQCVELSQSAALSRDIKIINRVVDDPHLAVFGDSRRLHQVILNLMSNAIKYNRTGGVVYLATAWSSRRNKVRIVVTDTGTGISPDKLPQLFQRFNRLGQEKNTVLGTGIGLILSKTLVETMGGDIGVRSQPGRGTSFWVDLRADTKTQPKYLEAVPSSNDYKFNTAVASPMIADGESMAGKKVLVVEDHIANQDLFRAQLNILGVTADFACNGAEGYRAWQKEYHDIVLTDIHMPEMDGVELIRAIRLAEKSVGKRAYIVVVSADVLSDEISRAFDAGCDASLTKPVELAKLREAINNLSTDGPPSDGAVAADATASPIDRSILCGFVGDDMKIQNDILQKFCVQAELSNAEIERCYGGQAAEELRAAAHKFKSSARAIGATNLAASLQDLENAARARDWGGMEAIMTALRGAYTDIITMLSADRPV